MKRIHLSVPHICGTELGYIHETFSSNWLSTVGPNVDAFEVEFQRLIGRPALAVSSGTAAIHLGLRLLGVGPEDEVLCSTLTFVGACNPIRYLGAEPVFVDSERSSWNMDPNLLEEALRDRLRQGRRPRAVVVVHLFGQCADMDPIVALCREFEVPVLEDAADSLGSTYKGRPSGSIGEIGAFSFNGNKIITSAGGGMLVASDAHRIEKARYWSRQAKDPGIGYTHSEVGYNYALSNVLAAIGRSQLQFLDDRIKARRKIAFRYQACFADLPGITLMPQASYGLHTNWLSCFLIDRHKFGIGRDELIQVLAAADIESRPVWKPMHLQPAYASCATYGGQVAEQLCDTGICLPSSSSLSWPEQLFVINVLRSTIGAPPVQS